VKRVAVVQSNYVPWKGYFDLIGSVDEFILLDDVQYTRRDWRNRNRIKTARGLKWLTIPVKVKDRYQQRIDETVIDGPGWARSHWSALTQAYREAACFDEVAPRIQPLYLESGSTRLSEINRRFIESLCAELAIETKLSWSADYEVGGAKDDRLLELCRKAGADEYVSGPAARAYLDESKFAEAGVTVSWFDYTGYPEYPQLHGEFEHQVSVLDLIFNTGSRAPDYLTSVPRSV